MGASCSSIDPNLQKTLDLKFKYSMYNRDVVVEQYGKNKANKLDINKLKSLQLKLWEHYKVFFKYKNELERTNNQLYQKFFGKDLVSTHIEVRNISADEMPKFIFFFNKREYHSVKMHNCSLVFPRFSSQYFPKFEDNVSKLTQIIINDSIIVFEKDSLDPYIRLENLEYLDLSFNNIDEIPDNFKRLLSVKILLLKRNSLTTLPHSMFELENLQELNLTDNKLTKVPNLNYVKLVKLNLSLNLLEYFECQVNTNNPRLTYLILAHNELKEIPKDISKFKKLKHVALDFNKIKEIPDWVKHDIDIKLNISLLNNNIKNKDAAAKESNKRLEIINDILIVTPLNESSTKIKETKSKETTFREEKKEAQFDLLANFSKEEALEVERICKAEQILAAKSLLELNIKKKVDNMLDDAKRNSRGLDLLRVEVKSGKLKIVIEEFKKIIDTKQESDIARFGDFPLKQLIKTIYGVFNKYDEFKISKEIPRDLSDLEKEIFAYLKQSKSFNPPTSSNISQATTNPTQESNSSGSSNLHFLMTLKNQLVNSKVMLYVKYLANIDTKLSEYLKLLIDENDKNSLIILITELKLFIKYLIDFYDANTGDQLETIYEHKVTQNVIHKIFKDSLTIKMLYRLGLRNFKFKNNVEIAEFVMTHSVNEKYKIMENYLMRFIKFFKLNKIDLTGLD